MDREAWRAVIHGVAKSQTRLSDWTERNWIFLYTLLIIFYYFNTCIYLLFSEYCHGGLWVTITFAITDDVTMKSILPVLLFQVNPPVRPDLCWRACGQLTASFSDARELVSTTAFLHLYTLEREFRFLIFSGMLELSQTFSHWWRMWTSSLASAHLYGCSAHLFLTELQGVSLC